MWVKRHHKPPMTGNGLNPAYIFMMTGGFYPHHRIILGYSRIMFQYLGCEQLNPCSGYVVWSITRSLALPSPAFQESMAESCGLFFAALGS